MRFEGKLDKWNDDRGFGFIAPSRGGEPVFIHISAFPRGGQRPQVGEPLSFEVEPAGDGKKRAFRVQRPVARPARRLRDETPAAPDWHWRGGISRRFTGLALAALVALVAAHWGYGQFNFGKGAALAIVEAPSVPEAPPAAMPTFRCDGRTHCSQMTSCAEATFFLQNCPGTKMDGDRDGVPCEDQWCSGGSRR